MFKKFIPKEDIASSTSIKSSVQRSIRIKLLNQFPLLNLPSLPLSISHQGEEDSDYSGSESEEEKVVVVEKKKKGANKEKKANKEKDKGGRGKKEEVLIGGGGENEGVEGGEEEVLSLLDVLWPKKEGITLIKCREHISILALNSEPLFFQHFDGPYFPTLKLLHKYPALLPKVKVDRGAIKFVLAGANIMCPGLTSPTASLPKEDLPIGTLVGIYAAGKEFALGIGFLTMSINDIKTINKNVGVENVCNLGDDFWNVGKL